MKSLFELANFFFASSIKLGPMWYHLNMVGPIEKIPMQANLYSPTGLFIKISGWSGVRFSVFYFYHTGSFAHIIFPVVQGPVFCPVSGFYTSYGCIKIFLKEKNFCCTSNSF